MNKKQRALLVMIILWIIGMTWLNILILQQYPKVPNPSTQNYSQEQEQNDNEYSQEQDTNEWILWLVEFQLPTQNITAAIAGNFTTSNYKMYASPYFRGAWDAKQPLLQAFNPNISLIMICYYDSSQKNYSTLILDWPYFIQEEIPLEKGLWVFYLQIHYLNDTWTPLEILFSFYTNEMVSRGVKTP